MKASDILQNGTAVALAIIGVAFVAVFVSKNSATTSVLSATGNSFAQSIRCALGPIIGGGNCGGTATSTISFGGITS